MALEKLHEEQTELSEETIDAHRGYVSLIEELEAVDWYTQRAAATDDEQLKEILRHNRNEEIEHACMLLEWLRRSQEGWNETLQTYLFRQEKITEVEAEDEQEIAHQDLNIGQIRQKEG
jgi:ferritin-like protein